MEMHVLTLWNPNSTAYEKLFLFDLNTSCTHRLACMVMVIRTLESSVEHSFCDLTGTCRTNDADKRSTFGLWIENIDPVFTIVEDSKCIRLRIWERHCHGSTIFKIKRQSDNCKRSGAQLAYALTCWAAVRRFSRGLEPMLCHGSYLVDYKPLHAACSTVPYLPPSLFALMSAHAE